MRTCSLLVLLGSRGNIGDNGNGGCNDDDCEGRGDYDGLMVMKIMVPKVMVMII